MFAKEKEVRRKTSILFGLILLMGTLVPTPAGAATCPEFDLINGDSKSKGTLSAPLSGNQVVGGGDPDGTGSVTLTIIIDSKYDNSIEYQIDTNDVAIPLEGAHIHKAPVGDTGKIVVTLFSTVWDQPNRSGVVDGVSKCLAHQLLHQSDDFYVDVHNGEYPDNGAVRGQIRDPGTT